MGGGEALRIKKAYKKFLLAFEQHLSQGTIVEIRKVSCLVLCHGLSRLLWCATYWSVLLDVVLAENCIVLERSLNGCGCTAYTNLSCVRCDADEQHTCWCSYSDRNLLVHSGSSNLIELQNNILITTERVAQCFPIKMGN